MSTEAMKLALDDLISEYYMENSSFAKRVADIFKAAPTQPQQEPVAWIEEATVKLALGAITAYLSESPDPSEEAVEGLCDARAILRQALAKQPAPVAQPQQEPVAWMHKIDCDRDDRDDFMAYYKRTPGYCIPLYTSPQPAQQEQEPVASLLAAIQAEPVTLIQKWRVLELVKDYTPQPAQQEPSNLKRLASIYQELNMSNYTSDDVDELNNWAIEVVTAIDALAEQPAQQEPAGWRPATFHRDNLTFNPGLPDEQTVKFWKLQGVEIEYCYTIPQPAQRKPLTSAEIRKWWASENNLEDCVMSKLDDFEQVVRAIEAAHGIKENT